MLPVLISIIQHPTSNIQHPFSIFHYRSFTGHAGAVYTIDSDGRFVYSGSADKFVVRWNVETGEQDAFAIKLPATPYALKLFAANTLLAVGLATGDLHFFDLGLRREVKFYKQHQSAIFCIAEDPLHNQLLVADDTGTISVWDTNSFELKIVVPLDCGKIRRIVVSADGSCAYVCGQDGWMRVLDLVSFNELHSFYAHEGGVTTALEWGKLLLTGGKDAHLKLWDLTIERCVKSIPAHNFVVYDLLELEAGHFVSASRDKTMKVWNSETLQVTQRIERKNQGHKHSVNALTKVGDNHFASCSDDGTVVVWGIQR